MGAMSRLDTLYSITGNCNILCNWIMIVVLIIGGISLNDLFPNSLPPPFIHSFLLPYLPPSLGLVHVTVTPSKCRAMCVYWNYYYFYYVYSFDSYTYKQCYVVTLFRTNTVEYSEFKPSSVASVWTSKTANEQPILVGTILKRYQLNKPCPFSKSGHRNIFN